MPRSKSLSKSLQKSFLGLLMLLLFVGCGTSAPTVEPTPESTPWLFPEPQIKLLSEKDLRVRGLALKNLAKMGAKAESAIPAIEKLLEKEKEPRIRTLAEKTLSQIREAVSEGS